MLTLLLMAQGVTAEAVLNRYEQFLKKNDSLSVVIKGTVNTRSFGTGSLRFDRPHKMNLSVKLPEGEAAFILNQTMGLEVNKNEQVYAEYPPAGKLYVPPFRLGTVLNYVAPFAMIEGNLRGLIPQGARPRVTPKLTVNGVQTDMVTADAETQSGSVNVKVWIDMGGRLIKYQSIHKTQLGTLTVVQEFSNYVSNPKFPDSVFSTSLPLGYVPYELPRADFGLRQGEAVPNVSLKAADTGAAANLSSLMAGKNTMVLVTDPDYPSNKELLKSVKNVSMKIPDFRLVVISMRKDPSAAKKIGVSGAYYDPTGAELEKLVIPGSPTMFLVDKKGKLQQMYFGFDGEWEGLDKVIEILKKGG